MKSAEFRIGRTFGVAFEHGDDFYATLSGFCSENDVRQGYIPMFIAGFARADLVGTCEKLENPQAPVWSKVHLENVEALGGGTIAYDPENRRILPHIHVTVGMKELSALGHTSHLLSATVQFLVEMIVVEVLSPNMLRIPHPGLFDVPLLSFRD